MAWIRKGTVHLLSLLLFVALVGGVLSASAAATVSKPAKIEGWLKQSNFYSALSTHTIDQAEQASSSVSRGAVSISFKDPAIQQIAKSTLSPQVTQQYTTTFLNSNYAWLKGNINSPNFAIDLTGLKQKFAAQVGRAVQANLEDLQLCSVSQLSQLQTEQPVDVFNLPCLPVTLDPQSVATEVSQAFESSDAYLSNAKITASSLNPNHPSQGKPYYQRLSGAPKAYRWIVKLPWICAVAAIVFLFGIFFLAPRKRRGLRRISIVFLLAAIVLIAIKFIADGVLKSVEHTIFKKYDAGSLQQSLTNFLNILERHLTNIDLMWGVLFLVIALLGFVVLRVKRQPKLQPITAASSDANTRPLVPSAGRSLANVPSKLDSRDLRLPTRKSAPKRSDNFPGPKGPKPPRLIQ